MVDVGWTREMVGLEVVALQSMLSVLRRLIEACRDVPTSLHLPKEAEDRISSILPRVCLDICHSIR
jgi:hypothetical protein